MKKEYRLTIQSIGEGKILSEKTQTISSSRAPRIGEGYSTLTDPPTKHVISNVKAILTVIRYKREVVLEKQDLFCPSCGKKELYREDGEGDYYLGSQYFCHSCYTIHHLDGCYCYVDAEDKKTFEQIESILKESP